MKNYIFYNLSANSQSVLIRFGTSPCESCDPHLISAPVEPREYADLLPFVCSRRWWEWRFVWPPATFYLFQLVDFNRAAVSCLAIMYIIYTCDLTHSLLSSAVSPVWSLESPPTLPQHTEIHRWTCRWTPCWFPFNKVLGPISCAACFLYFCSWYSTVESIYLNNSFCSPSVYLQPLSYPCLLNGFLSWGPLWQLLFPLCKTVQYKQNNRVF